MVSPKQIVQSGRFKFVSPLLLFLTGCSAIPFTTPQPVSPEKCALAAVQPAGSLEQLKLELDTAVRFDLAKAINFVGDRLKGFDIHIHRRDVAKVALFGGGQAANIAASTLGATKSVIANHPWVVGLGAAATALTGTGAQLDQTALSAEYYATAANEIVTNVKTNLDNFDQATQAISAAKTIDQAYAAAAKAENAVLRIQSSSVLYGRPIIKVQGGPASAKDKTDKAKENSPQTTTTSQTATTTDTTSIEN